MKILTGKRPRPRRILLYGIHGVGKSTWAATAPRPIFLNIEDGLDDIDCAHTDHIIDHGGVIGAISWLIQNGQDFDTVVIDTLDWLEQLVFKQVAESKGEGNIEDIGYGKGYTFALKSWDFLLKGLEELRKRGKTIILLAHARISRFNDPNGESYDRCGADAPGSTLTAKQSQAKNCQN